LTSALIRPVLIELDGEACHWLHRAIGQRDLHEELSVLAGERSGNLQPLALGRRQPDLKQRA